MEDALGGVTKFPVPSFGAINHLFARMWHCFRVLVNATTNWDTSRSSMAFRFLGSEPSCTPTMNTCPAESPCSPCMNQKYPWLVMIKHPYIVRGAKSEP